MTITAKDRKKAESLRISQIGDFKTRLGGIMELPSGLVVKARNPGGLRAFMSSGVIPNSLMSIIQKGMSSGKAPAAEEIMADGKVDAQLLEDMTTLLDYIAIKTIVEPKIHAAITSADLIEWNRVNPEHQYSDVEELRRDDRLYVDELPDDDKQFLFQWISGGTRDLETFRQKLDVNVDAISAVTSNDVATKPAAGSDVR